MNKINAAEPTQVNRFATYSMPITDTATATPEVLVLEPKVFGDARVFCYESFNARDFAQKTGLQVDFVQDKA